jgi:hypothetical protein
MTRGLGILTFKRFRSSSVSQSKPWSGPLASGPIGWICELAFADREASASDALRQSRPETLKLHDPLVDPLRPSDREARRLL